MNELMIYVFPSKHCRTFNSHDPRPNKEQAEAHGLFVPILLNPYNICNTKSIYNIQPKN